ncbi:hypothetical protein B4U80_09272 [Leptotrombidium deliense]|uniref:Ribonuclease PIN domain-containing protein n=1 Tax=Leptotrombidium deliense TaxID=299467 RepID=A0A443RVK5_9ACAR|nr:hypothetical protein B4U80_09272 [Leptotrombidium deliense]
MGGIDKQNQRKVNSSKMERKKIDYLVIDSGAFIKGTQLHELSDNLYTIHEVISEIKDKATKARLEALPYEL